MTIIYFHDTTKNYYDIVFTWVFNLCCVFNVEEKTNVDNQMRMVFYNCLSIFFYTREKSYWSVFCANTTTTHKKERKKKFRISQFLFTYDRCLTLYNEHTLPVWKETRWLAISNSIFLNTKTASRIVSKCCTYSNTGEMNFLYTLNINRCIYSVL